MGINNKIGTELNICISKDFNKKFKTGIIIEIKPDFFM